jgi:uncharacterized protein
VDAEVVATVFRLEAIVIESIHICVFAKPPRPGEVKTRLIPSLGENGAAMLADALLRDTLDSIAGLTWARPVLATTKESPALNSRDLPIWLQGGGDLGERLERILRRALEQSGAAIAVGADSPGLPRALLERARALLDAYDVVLGPCTDGGFYLLALKSCPKGLLGEIPWSAPTTFERTLAKLKARGLSVALLDPWFDIDRPEDLNSLADLLLAGSVRAPQTARTLASLLPLPSKRDR